MSWLEFTPLFTDELHQLGHFGDLSKSDADKLQPTDAEYVAAVESFQPYVGLDPTGELDELTQRSLRFRCDHHGNQRCCGLPDIQPAVEEANIPNGTVTWTDPKQPIVMAYNFGKLPGLTAEQTRLSWLTVIAEINATCGVRIVLGEWRDAHVRITLDRLSGSTLALALLSTGSRRIGGHYQKYDSDRTWGEPLAKGVKLHEWGHTLGLHHSKSRADIMYAIARSNVNSYQPGDIRRLVDAYGEPLDVPDKPDGPDKPLPPGKQQFDGMFRVGSQVIRMEGTANVIG